MTPLEPTRRQMVISGLAASATLVAPSLAMAEEPAATKPARLVNIGLIGCGGRGNLIADRVVKHGGYKLAAVCDYFPDVAKATAEKHGVPADRAFSGLKGYQRMLESKAVDAVLLETPPCFFPQHAAAAVAAGVHVYMAKPLACDVPGTFAVRDAAQRATAAKQVFFVDFQMRVDPFIVEVAKRVADGALEGFSLARSFYDDEGFADPALTATIESRLRNLVWVNDTALGGSYLVNAGIHAIDCALWLTNSTAVRAVGHSARTRKDPHGDTHDAYSITYTLSNGLILNHSGEHLYNKSGFRCGVDVAGHGARLEARYANGKSWIYGGGKQFKGGETPDLYTRGIETNLATFHRCIVECNYANPTVEPSVQSNLAVLLGREACLRGSEMTMQDLIKENKALPVDVMGLAE